MLIITSGSVKVMRSFDYCHFEIILGGESDKSGPITEKDIDDLRKKAARLADKAVEQYKTKKANLAQVESDTRTLKWNAAEVERINGLAETDRTDEEKAVLKSAQDAAFRASRPFDYQDDWEQEPAEE